MKIFPLSPGKIVGKLVNKLFSDILYVRSFIDYDKIDKSPRSEEATLRTMNKGFKILDEIGVSYCLGRGSLLGVYRDGKFLPRDIDIDVDVFSDKHIYEIIRKLPFEIVIVTNSEGHYQQLAFIDRDTNVLFDIFFYHKKKDLYINRNYYGYFSLPEEQVNNLTKINFKGVTYKCLEPEWFCKYWYGNDFRTPKKYNADWTIDYRRDCSAFQYAGISNVKHFR